MAITYPGTLDVFTNPTGTSTLDSPDHALQHSNVNDAIEAVQAVVGTTAGTAVLMDFTAGEFPIKQEGGALVETITGGTINTTTLGTPTVTGGSFASPTTTGTDAGTATLTNKDISSFTNTFHSGETLQVVSSVYSTKVETTNVGTNPVATGLYGTITPKSSSNKILVLVSTGELKNTNASSGITVDIYRGASNISQIAKFACFPTAGAREYASKNYLDSPGTTSAIVYSTKFYRSVGTGTVAHCEDGTQTNMTLMEIVG